ncbi:MAG: ATP-binding protein [Fuerstiella sp.]
MPRCNLLIINGPGRGTRIDLLPHRKTYVIGRSVGSTIRIDDTEVSRRHAEISFHDGNFRITDLASANGTFLDGERISNEILRTGNSLRIGSTLLTFQNPESSVSPNAPVVRVVPAEIQQHSAIVQHVQSDEAAKAEAFPNQQSSLELLYQVSEEIVRASHTLESMLQRILDLTATAVGADRACFLLTDSTGTELVPLVSWVSEAKYSERPMQHDSHTEGANELLISGSITHHVLTTSEAIRTADAQQDSRFQAANSVVSGGITEVLCAPMKGHESVLGVLYLDIVNSQNQQLTGTSRRFVDEHLKSVLSVARQSAFAVDARQYQDALLKAERFAAMGQTITVLSHHIKNILQGMKGGGYLIETGLTQSNDEFVSQGWGIVERNQNRIYDLVTDMLSFSKDRVPKLKQSDLNVVCQEVAELAASKAAENGVQFQFQPDTKVPEGWFDQEGIHRSVLNIVMNGIDAVAETENGEVILQTSYDSNADVLLVAVTDNGPGIPEDQQANVFHLFESSKGAGGTGIGLPVSRKIIREHGGRISIESKPGEGTRFTLTWPRGNSRPNHGVTDPGQTLPHDWKPFQA